ncbi:MAG: hypothetical protein QOD42_3355 [Sphingomonadales bacterium]|jgi:hypothetical protein|nr:hypothetical protein [Sphingomonadales bacterium]
MSGPNQHHIPQFLQRGFGAARKGKPKDIWQYAKGVAPELRPISKTASGDHFYSQALDDKITEAETPLANLYHKVRALPVGSAVAPDSAAELITHLAPRTSHIRESLTAGFSQFATGARDRFTDPALMEQLMGLHEDEPSEQFREKLREGLRDMPQIEHVGLPGPVLERVAFYVAKENFDTAVGDTASLFGPMLSEFAAGSGEMARDGHIRALDEMGDKPNLRRDLLAGFAWTVERAPEGGAILPDCVALAYSSDGAGLPLMFVGKEMDAVVMPLTKDRLLVGRRNGAPDFPIGEFNTDAAACSQTFFLAHADCAPFETLQPLIGTRSDAYFSDVMRDVFESVLPQGPKATSDESGEERAPAHLPRDCDLEFSCLIRCADFGNDEIYQRVSDGAAAIIRALARTLPLSRLDSIVFAFDFPGALRAVDRGSADLGPVEAVNSGEEGCVGRMVTVMREGKLKACIVFNGNVAACLIGENEDDQGTAMMIMVHQLTLVAMIELVERALPGAFDSPIEDELQAGLFSQARDAVTGYAAARLSAGFGNAADAESYHRERLIAALKAMKTDVEAERLSYRYHADLGRLLQVAMPAVGQVLSAASDLLGVCAGSDRPVFDDEGSLKTALNEANLPHWLPTFARDLERFFDRLGAWESIDEFLAFNRHTERLLWSVGLFPWTSPEGGRFEVPLVTDAQALLADLVGAAR